LDEIPGLILAGEDAKLDSGWKRSQVEFWLEEIPGLILAGEDPTLYSDWKRSQV
jgi:hypothetical protein